MLTKRCDAEVYTKHWRMLLGHNSGYIMETTFHKAIWTDRITK